MRVLLTMATGTGQDGRRLPDLLEALERPLEPHTASTARPKILFLADRNVLVDDPKDKTFAPFGDARCKIENGEVVKSREMYFAIYQAIAKDENRPGLYKEFPPDFFDLIVVDECHRGSARDESNWREILEYFEPAYQLGMTATPLRDDNRDTYAYFGNPVYTYSLQAGHRRRLPRPLPRAPGRSPPSTPPAGGPTKGELDRYGREIPDDEYHTKDFERVVSLQGPHRGHRPAPDGVPQEDRPLRQDDRLLRRPGARRRDAAGLDNLNADLVQQYPDYVCRVTSDEGDIGRGHLSRFQDLETQTPGHPHHLAAADHRRRCPDLQERRPGPRHRLDDRVQADHRPGDAGPRRLRQALLQHPRLHRLGHPDVRRPRLRRRAGHDDRGATSTTRARRSRGPSRSSSRRRRKTSLRESSEPTDEDGSTRTTTWMMTQSQAGRRARPRIEEVDEGAGEERRRAGPRKYYVDGRGGEVATELEYELDPEGNNLGVVLIHDYAADKVRTLSSTLAEFREKWADPKQRAEIMAMFEDWGIDLDQLATVTNHPDADPFDLLCHLAFNAPLRTRRERAERLKADKTGLLRPVRPRGPSHPERTPRQVRRARDRPNSDCPRLLEVPPISTHGNVMEIAAFFGGAEQLVAAVQQLQTILYAA